MVESSVNNVLLILMCLFVNIYYFLNIAPVHIENRAVLEIRFFICYHTIILRKYANSNIKILQRLYYCVLGIAIP